MRLYTVNKSGKLIPYKEENFSEDNKEVDLENLLEINPEYFFEDRKILIIGKQVPTNLGSWIDLLGIDKHGNTVAIELKRGRTPRETIAQLLEYASFIENLDYEQLNSIFQNYVSEETVLEDYHQEYFQISQEDIVSFNKTTRLIIVAQDISNSIKQTALYLRKKGIDIYCMEFKYFLNQALEKMITSDFIVGDESFIKGDVKSATQLPKVDEKKFLESLDKYGNPVFEKLFDYAKNNNLLLRWGSKGFSLNVSLENGFVGLCFGFPPESVFKQSIYTGFEEINRKVKNPELLVNYFKSELGKTGYFVPARSNMKWLINKPFNHTDIDKFLAVLSRIINKIKESGLNE